jgi:hypothetical protein
VKIRHHVPVEQVMRPDPVSPEYQAEVDRSTAKAEREYRRAQRELARVERRLEQERSRGRGRPGPRKRRYIAELEAEVELRRTRLLELHRMMLASPQSAQHRGTRDPHRHVPTPGVF